VTNDNVKTVVEEVASVSDLVKNIKRGQKPEIQPLPDFLEPHIHKLSLTKEGALKATPLTIETILRYDPTWAGGFRYNRRFMEVDFLKKFPFPRGSHEEKNVNPDTDIHRIIAWFNEKYDIDPTDKKTMAAIGAIANENGYDPIVDYFESLKWDGVPRIDQWLIRLAGATDTPINREFSKRWLIGGAARAYNPGEKVDYMLILMGPQGVGKSTVFEILAGPKYFTDHLSDIAHKDAKIELQGPLIIEMSELENLNRKDITAVKSFLTIKSDRFRAPFGRSVNEHPRMMIFAGTTNQSTFSKDTTGARRFWPVHVGAIDLAGIRARRDQLWAEAVHCYKAGENWLIPPAMLHDAMEAQESIRIKGASEDEIFNYVTASRHAAEAKMGGPLQFRWARCFDPSGRRTHLAIEEVFKLLDIPKKDQSRHLFEIKEAIESVLRGNITERRRMEDGKRATLYVIPEDFWEAVKADPEAYLAELTQAQAEDDLDDWD